MKTNQAALEAFNKWMDSAGCLEQRHFDNGDIRIELARSADTIRKALTANTWQTIDVKPEDFVDVLVLFEGGNSRYDIANWDSDAGWWSLPNQQFSQPDIEPTHWKHLDKPEQPPC